MILKRNLRCKLKAQSRITLREILKQLKLSQRPRKFKQWKEAQLKELLWRTQLNEEVRNY
jgi:hypothetical protein